MDSTQIKGMIEALIFAAPEPLPLQKLAQLLKRPEEELLPILEELKAEYRHRAGGFILEESAGAYYFCTREEYRHLIRALLKVAPLRLSRAHLEVLAIIAYRQPLTRAEIEAIRGVESSGALRTLMEAGLVTVVGEKEVAGKPRLYGTTPYFLQFFALKDLSQLPPLPEEWKKQGFPTPSEEKTEAGKAEEPALPLGESLEL